MASLLGRALRRYTKWLEDYPYRTQILTNGPLWGGGDVLAQLLEKRDSLDFARTARMTAYGFCVAGPLYCWWYAYLERRCLPLKARSLWTYIAAKVAADQLIFEPPNLCVFFTASSLLEGHGLAMARDRIRSRFTETFIADCAVWPAAQVLNFKAIPLSYQALYVNAVSIAWSAFLSHVNQKPHRDDAASSAPPAIILVSNNEKIAA